MSTIRIAPGNGFQGGEVDLHNNTITMTDANGQLVKMDLGVTDVHIDAALTNYINGYKPAEFMADQVAPPVIVAKASNFYFQFDPDNALATVDGTQVAPGADPPVVTPKLSSTRYSTLGYSLASVIPTEVLANQDAPLNMQMTATRMIMDRLMLNREVRVKNIAYSTANFTGAHLVDLTGSPSTLKWNGGTASDPVANIMAIQEAALMPITDMLMSLDTWNAFTRNAAVQKYTGFKQQVQGIPTPDQRAAFSSFLNLPRIHVAETRAKSAAGVYPFVWSGDVVLFRRPPQDVSDMDVATFKTFRWNGAEGNTLPTEFGGQINGGLTVRSFFNPFKGKRGVHTVIVAHDDAEQFMTANVGGLIHGAFQ